MSRITGSEAKSLMEAYNAVYASQEENELVEEIFETISFALISQGYSAVDVLEYFANVDNEVIVEDLIALSEGTLLIESTVSEEYIQEQLEQLDEILGIASRVAAPFIRPAAKLVAKGASKLASKAQDIVWKTTPASSKKLLPAAGTKSAAPVVRQPNLLQKAGSAVSTAVGKVKDAARGALNKLPGGAGGKLASGLKTAGKWALGGAAFEGGMRAVQGLMGGKGPQQAKTTPTSKPPKAGMVDTAKGQRYKSSSDGKHYANYNDALAARNSRRGVKPAPTPAPAKPAAAAPAAAPSPSPKVVPAKPSTPTAQAKPAPDTTEKPKRPSIAQDVEDIKQMQQRSRQRQGELMGGPEGPGKIDTKSVEADLKAAQEREKRKLTSATKTESYDAYDIVLEYLLDEGHVETLQEAHYVMLEMDSETINSIVEAQYRG